MALAGSRRRGAGEDELTAGWDERDDGDPLSASSPSRPPFGVRLHEAVVRDYYEDGGALRLSVRVVSRRAAQLAWMPKGAFAEREVQVVYAPAGASYKVVMSLSDPVGDSVDLTDLRPYTIYQLSVRAKDQFTQGNTVVVANMNFSTADLSLVDPERVSFHPPGELGQVQVDEIFIVVMVLLVWAAAVYVFFNQWDKMVNTPEGAKSNFCCCLSSGKIRGIIPYQPAFRKYEVVDVVGEHGDVDTAALIPGANCPQCETRQFHLCRKAMTLDELMLSAGVVPPPPGSRYRRPPHRNHSAIFYQWDSLPEEAAGGLAYGGGGVGPQHYYQNGGVGSNAGLRKTRSAESVLFMQRPKIVVDGTWDEGDKEANEDEKDEARVKKQTKQLHEETSGDPIDGAKEEHDGDQAMEQVDSGADIKQNVLRADSSHFLHPPPTHLGGGHFASADGSLISSTSNTATAGGANHVISSPKFQHQTSLTEPPQAQARPHQFDPISHILMLQSTKRAFLNSIRQGSSNSSTGNHPAPFASFDSSSMGIRHARSTSPGILTAVSPERLNSTSPPPPNSSAAAAPASPYHYFPYHHLRGRQYVGSAGSLGSASATAPVLRHQSSLVENTIPLTTKMVNRMKKKEPPSAAHQMARQYTQMSQSSLQHQSSIAGAAAAAAAVGVPTVRRGGPGDAGADFLRRKVGHISAESDSSAASSSSPYLLSAPYFATKQRVGSLRSRLKKQHPILLSDSDPNPEFLVTSVEREEAAAAAAAAAATSSSPSPTLGNSGRMRTTVETHSDSIRQHPLHLSGLTMVRRGATPAVANVSPRSSCEEAAAATDPRPASRWSVASEADSGPSTRVFFRHASGGNMADKSNFSSRDDSKDEGDSGKKESRVSSAQGAADAFLSVTYKAISSEESNAAV